MKEEEGGWRFNNFGMGFTIRAAVAYRQVQGSLSPQMHQPEEVYRSLSQYIYFYNYERPHQALDYRAPAQVVRHKPACDKLNFSSRE